MRTERRDVVVIGGGPAGLAAAVELKKRGIEDVLVVEREKNLGGILRQCIHDGFGLTRFGESLSGPEYAQRFIDEAKQLHIECLTGTTVLHLTADRQVTLASPDGMRRIEAKAVILAMGCRERTRGALGIPGERPAGVFTAGVAQAYMNLYNRMVGKNVVILGSGDIGLIMARRLTLEGVHVQAVFEIQPIPSGLPRNIRQCLEDYDIPLYLSHTITEIHGNERVCGVTVSEVDERMHPIAGTEKHYDCDTVILSVGLIPENELSLEAGVELDPHTRGAVVDEYFQTSVRGIFAAGNVLHVHDLVDFVSQEAEKLAKGVQRMLEEEKLGDCAIPLTCDRSLNHVLPHRITGEEDVALSMRVSAPRGECAVVLRQNGEEIQRHRMKKALPAEMIQFTLKHQNIQGRTGIEVSVE